MLEWYAATSEVPWLFLLAAWVFAFTAVAGVYAAWNRAGLELHLEAKAGRPGAGSPLEVVSEQLLRGAPLPCPVFEGDDLEVEVGLDTTGPARGPAWISGSLGRREVALGTGLVPRAGWRRPHMMGSLRRGPVDATSWQIASSDPLGLFRSRRRCADTEVALALPRFTSLAARMETRELEASLAAPRAGSGTELFGVREYRPGDPLRRIHWRSSARHGELVVREFEPPGVRTLGIFCDPSPATAAVADQVARIAASEAWDCIRAGGRVLLWSPGMEPSSQAESRSFWSVLEWLARYPHPALTHAAERRVGRSEPPQSVGEAVSVTGSPDREVMDALETVRSRGGLVRAWVVGDAELDIDGSVMHVGTGWPL
ncbi:MAG TPA: DUF58 domain-containing protein [Candidatus Dormibacteraeota bacterium]